jgi:hypothetical protein
MSGFSGSAMGLGTIDRLSHAKTRLITAENVYGEKGKGGMADLTTEPQPEVARIGQHWDGPNGAARELGQKWKVRPCITLPKGVETTLVDVDGPGYIQHIWITLDYHHFRNLILRFYWDGETEPSVESPVGDFFCNGFNTPTPVTALPINVNPNGGFNCFFPMPYRKHARITIQNRHDSDVGGLYYAVTLAETDVPDDAAYFHAQFRRTNPLPYGTDYTILEGVVGQGHYVGTYMAWQQNNNGWWGEGEIKFFLDGDGEFASLVGTGTEDYFGGAWCFGALYSAPFMGYPLGAVDNKPGGRHGLYRFHIMDPIRFEQDLKVTMQAIGWRSEGRYLPLQDDIASVAYWYQAEPHSKFPPIGDRNALETI